MAPFHRLEAGRLIRPTSAVAGARAAELIDAFVRKYATIDRRIVWTSPVARSELVVHPADRTLRIDAQKPFPDPAAPGVPWGNLQLQHGANSLACVLLTMGRPYPAEDVRAAWLDSLAQARNARMTWRFKADKIEYAVLQSLDGAEPRAAPEIARRMRQGFGWGVPGVIGLEFQNAYLTGNRIPEALQQLVGAKLAAKYPAGWTLTAEGAKYRMDATNNPFVFG